MTLTEEPSMVTFFLCPPVHQNDETAGVFTGHKPHAVSFELRGLGKYGPVLLYYHILCILYCLVLTSC